MRHPEPGESWGVLGGQFDPVHYGHINLVLHIVEAKKLDGALFVPSVAHPFKASFVSTPFEDRAAMVALALHGYENMLLSTIEQSQNLSGYTLDTVTALQKQYPGTKLCFIMGADNLRQLVRWHQPDEILKKVRLLVGNRPGELLDIPEEISSDKVELVETGNINISSTEIRNAIGDGTNREDIERMIPGPVFEYIIQKGLYQ